jgi:putative isomerase
MRKIILTCFAFACFLHALCQHSREQYKDLLDLRQSLPMAHVNQTDAMLFSDLGAWHGYSLPANEAEYGGFNGPVLFNEIGYVLANSFAKLSLAVDGKAYPFQKPDQAYFPGILRQQYSALGLEVTQSLIFYSSRSAVMKTTLINKSGKALQISAAISGTVKDKQYAISKNAATVSVKAKNGIFQSEIIGKWAFAIAVDDTAYTAKTEHDEVLGAGQQYSFYICQTFNTDGENPAAVKTPSVSELEKAFVQNRQRWDGYVSKILSHKTSWLKEEQYRRLAVKSLITLTTNWRSPAGSIRHSGIFPSYNFFDGFWAWDSWKHAAGCALFDVRLAEDNIRSMFDYQDGYGMIADCIFSDSSRNNYRNTKPPLAAWAVWQVFSKSQNVAFLKEMYPKLLAYHRWWYMYRDHDGNGLCEFGCTNGEQIAAAWESGMDNAVRFDSARLLRNHVHAWSFNRESVDLNSFLYLEKALLAKMGKLLGFGKQADSLQQQATVLQKQVQGLMFDEGTGFFYDIDIDTKRSIGLQGPEGWHPLWAGIASASIATQAIKTMADTIRFNTYLPFPTFQANHAAFDAKAYWRGPVWVDQAMFGIESLKKYGNYKLAQTMQYKLLHHAQGMLGNKPLRETYNPLTGEGMTVPNFSWTAASLLRLLCL